LSFAYGCVKIYTINKEKEHYMNRDGDFRRFQDDTHQLRQIKLLKSYWWGTQDSLTPRARGRLRERSFCDCGVSRCPMCSNPRYNRNLPIKEKLTIKERKYIEKFNEELRELYKTNNSIVDWLKD
jgi:hypothetical protein